MKTKVVWPLTLAASVLCLSAVVMALAIFFAADAVDMAALFFILSMFQYSLTYWGYLEGHSDD